MHQRLPPPPGGSLFAFLAAGSPSSSPTCRPLLSNFTVHKLGATPVSCTAVLHVVLCSPLFCFVAPISQVLHPGVLKFGSLIKFLAAFISSLSKSFSASGLCRQVPYRRCLPSGSKTSTSAPTMPSSHATFHRGCAGSSSRARTRILSMNAARFVGALLPVCAS